MVSDAEGSLQVPALRQLRYDEWRVCAHLHTKIPISVA